MDISPELLHESKNILPLVHQSEQTKTVMSETAAFFNLSLHTRINYKGYMEMKARQCGTNSGLGMLEVYFRAYCNVIHWRLFTRSYRYMAESKSFTGWKTFKGK